MSKAISIFISSKQGELDTERYIVRQRAQDSGLAAELAEEWPPGRADIRQVYLDRVAASSIYVGLFYRTYSPPTVEEYETAAANPYREMLIYWRDPDSEDKDPALQKFMENVRQHHVYRKYHKPEDLLVQVQEHLREALTRMMQLLIRLGTAPRGANLFGPLHQTRKLHPEQQFYRSLGFPEGQYDPAHAAKTIEDLEHAIALTES